MALHISNITSLASPQIDLNSRSLFSYFYTNYYVFLLFPETYYILFLFYWMALLRKAIQNVGWKCFLAPCQIREKIGMRSCPDPWTRPCRICPDKKKKCMCSPASYAWPFITGRQRLTKALIARGLGRCEIKGRSRIRERYSFRFRNVESIGIVSNSSNLGYLTLRYIV